MIACRENILLFSQESWNDFQKNMCFGGSFSFVLDCSILLYNVYISFFLLMQYLCFACNECFQLSSVVEIFRLFVSCKLSLRSSWKLDFFVYAMCHVLWKLVLFQTLFLRVICLCFFLFLIGFYNGMFIESEKI